MSTPTKVVLATVGGSALLSFAIVATFALA